MSYYVYELIDPRDDSVFYVGKGKKGRIDQHEAEAAKGRQSRKCERIRAIEAAGLKIKKRKASTHSDEVEAYDAEIALISFHGLANLTNVMSGGGGRSTGPTLYEDRMLIARVTPLLRRTLACRQRGHIGIQVLSEVITFEFILNMMNEMVQKVAKRRSLDWVNEIAASYHVRYKAA